MNRTLIIARRELGSFFDSLIAYVLLFIFLGITAFFIWLSPSNLLTGGQANLTLLFFIANWTLMFFIPSLTMRMLADEYRMGTIEMLRTKPVTASQILMGKFLAGMALVALCLVLTLPWYFTVSQLGDIDDASVIGGYLGLVLLSSAYMAIGLLCSSLTNNAIAAFIMALAIGFFFHFILGFLTSSSPAVAAQFGWFFAFSNRFDAFSRGVLDTRDILFFITFTGVLIATAEYLLERRRVKS